MEGDRFLRRCGEGRGQGAGKGPPSHRQQKAAVAFVGQDHADLCFRNDHSEQRDLVGVVATPRTENTDSGSRSWGQFA